MEIFKYKCPMCGGELDINEDHAIGICQYCNSKVAIPKNLGARNQMYNRATYLRQNNEFDRSIAVYEDILKRDNTDVEAHFGLLLSKYGIEYVEDPKSGERKPTCHRLQNQSIYADSDYKAVIEYADSTRRKMYEQEAARINEIVKRIQELAAKEKPYDIFICYKETDGEERTDDSRIAQNLYQRLERKGYRVFFARKTLENKLGLEYEPIIFSAINTAKVMIVLGTKKEFFNAVWVRNEWSRYLELTKENPEKVLVPAYKNMTAYDLPDELAVLQSQDMNKLGFMEDLQEAMEKCVKKTQKSNDHLFNIGEMEGKEESNLELALKNASTMFFLGEVEQAKHKMENLTDIYPGDYRSWLGYAMVLSGGLKKELDDKGKIIRCLKNAFKICPESEYDKLCSTCGKYLNAQYERLDYMRKGVSDEKTDLSNKVLQKNQQIEMCNDKYIKLGQQKQQNRAEYEHIKKDIENYKEVINGVSTKDAFGLGYSVAAVLGVVAYIILGIKTFRETNFLEALGEMLLVAPLLVGLGIAVVGLIFSAVACFLKNGEKSAAETQLIELQKALDICSEEYDHLNKEEYDNNHVRTKVFDELGDYKEKIKKVTVEMERLERIYNDFFPIYQKLDKSI